MSENEIVLLIFVAFCTIWAACMLIIIFPPSDFRAWRKLKGGYWERTYFIGWVKVTREDFDKVQHDKKEDHT